MRTTRTQPPDMKGKKFYEFRCGCCWARNCLEEERKKIALKEAVEEAVDFDADDGETR